MTLAACKTCTFEKPATLEYFPRRKNNKSGLDGSCRVCSRKRANAYYYAHHEKHKKAQRDRHYKYYERDAAWKRLSTKRYRDRVRLETLQHYARSPFPECACCGEMQLQFLCLDHINGGGTEERKRLGPGGVLFYCRLKAAGYPPGLQVLCHNCNMAKGFYGKCPHKP